ncbi:hypothetical protein MRB53_034460 [Persea americana]|uniref:Uncharacterized protein n=1 Tax=Persea americana TaxID=3435 RepID=A0ACC2K2E6_PERAE|nr:hypothetical protein MRB53_034460 [Persea americana]
MMPGVDILVVEPPLPPQAPPVVHPPAGHADPFYMSYAQYESIIRARFIFPIAFTGFGLELNNLRSCSDFSAVWMWQGQTQNQGLVACRGLIEEAQVTDVWAD